MLSVLIVDDHPHLVEHLQTIIPWSELNVTRVFPAFSGREAWETVLRTPIDILITDIRMPGMSGLELIEKTRAVRPEISCILLTGYAEFEYARKAIELQTFRYLMKPVRLEELIACIRELAAGRRFPDSNHAPVSQDSPESPDDGKSPGSQKLVDAVHDYVRKHLDGDVTLTAIAEHVFLHPVYLSKLYKETTGSNLSEFILTARMDRAKELLRQSPMKIYEICEAVGYRSTQHFITEFKKAVGVTPKQYRDA